MSDTTETPKGKTVERRQKSAGEWPNTIRKREELDRALEAGLKSDVSSRSMDEIIEDEIDHLKDG